MAIWTEMETPLDAEKLVVTFTAQKARNIKLHSDSFSTLQ